MAACMGLNVMFLINSKLIENLKGPFQNYPMHGAYAAWSCTQQGVYIIQVTTVEIFNIIEDDLKSKCTRKVLLGISNDTRCSS